MNRREFTRSVVGTLMATQALSKPSFAADTQNSPFDVPVMLWTVFRDLPFEMRLEKVAAAGYKNVELVGEYADWADSEFERANAKRKQLGITFDCTAGL